MGHNRAMHQAMSRAEQATVTRARIIDAARALADAAGDDAVRILDVAAAAQVSTGALYHHFAGREDLMTAVHLERYRGSLPEDLAFIDRLVDVAADGAALRAGLMELTRVVSRQERSAVRRQRAATIGRSVHQPEVAAALADEQRRTSATMAAALGRAQARGLIDPSADLIALTLMFQAIALGLVLADIDPGGAPTSAAWESLVGRMLDTVITG